MIGSVGKKMGITHILIKDGVSIPVIIIEVEANRVTRVKGLANDGYRTIQIATGAKKASHVTKPEAGHFAEAGVEAGRSLWELRPADDEEFVVGQGISVKLSADVKKVDVTGAPKNKSFVGTVKCWNLRTQDVTHGSPLSYHVPGSIGQNQTSDKVFKGKKVVGQLDNKRVVVQSLDVVCVDTEHNLLLVRGAVPGVTSSDLIVKPAAKA